VPFADPAPALDGLLDRVGRQAPKVIGTPVAAAGQPRAALPDVSKCGGAADEQADNHGAELPRLGGALRPSGSQGSRNLDDRQIVGRHAGRRQRRALGGRRSVTNS
jgi:hypothetical protein